MIGALPDGSAEGGTVWMRVLLTQTLVLLLTLFASGQTPVQSLSQGLAPVLALGAEGKFNEAHQLLVELLAKDRWNDPAAIADAIASAALKSAVSVEAAKIYFQAAREASTGQLKSGISRLDAAIVLEPRYAMFFNERGGWKLRDKQLKAALADFDTAVTLDPGLAIAYYNRAVAHIAGATWDAALADLDKAIALNPNDREAFVNRGNIKLQRSDAKAALSDYDRAVTISPTYAGGFYGRARAKSALGDHAGSVADYTKTIEFNPNHAEAYDNRGYALMLRLSKPEQGCPDWKRACELGRCANYNLAKTRKMCQ